MPGFNIGFGGGEVSPKIETRRKHRFEFKIDGVPRKTTLFLKKAERPQIKISVIETKFDQETAYWDGRHEWEPITLEFYDIEQETDTSDEIYKWFKRVLNIENNKAGPTPASPTNYKKQCTLEVYGGDGFNTERWVLSNCWPISVDWGDLDYSSSDIQTVKVVLRFDRAVREQLVGPTPAPPSSSPSDADVGLPVPG